MCSVTIIFSTLWRPKVNAYYTCTSNTVILPEITWNICTHSNIRSIFRLVVVFQQNVSESKASKIFFFSILSWYCSNNFNEFTQFLCSLYVFSMLLWQDTKTVPPIMFGNKYLCRLTVQISLKLGACSSWKYRIRDVCSLCGWSLLIDYYWNVRLFWRVPITIYIDYSGYHL